MSNSVLEVEKLTKRYGDFTAVDGISFVIPKGEVIGLLGPNGAGKTTTIQMLMGITLPTSGAIRYFGMDFATNHQRCLQRINYSSAYNQLQERITVHENLMVFAKLYALREPKKKIAELADYFGITDLLKQRFITLSAGQRTRVNLAKSLLNDPELIMLDEPTASLDPDVRDRLMSLIESMRKERNISILYTSHNMDEITRLCSQVIFLGNGVIRHHASPQELTDEVFDPSVALHFHGDGAALVQLLHRQGVQAELDGDVVTMLIDTPELPRVLGSLQELPDLRVVDIDIRKPTLDSVFLHYAKRPFIDTEQNEPA
jgi:ABC-2 type transport system ATP-binding protein